MPFMFSFHGDPDDFWRFSYKGMDLLCGRFEKVASRLGRGPASSMTHLMVPYQATLFSFNSKLV